MNPQPPAAAELGEMRQKLRMIVSHATGGASQDINASVNDICVRISANRNLVYQRGKDMAADEAAATIAALRAEVEEGRKVLEPFATLAEYYGSDDQGALATDCRAARAFLAKHDHA